MIIRLDEASPKEKLKDRISNRCLCCGKQVDKRSYLPFLSHAEPNCAKDFHHFYRYEECCLMDPNKREKIIEKCERLWTKLKNT
jgi:hypothetical protein